VCFEFKKDACYLSGILNLKLYLTFKFKTLSMSGEGLVAYKDDEIYREYRVFGSLVCGFISYPQLVCDLNI